MATPTLLFNSSTGSDTQASGAGPGTAIFGSTGRTRNTASQLHFGFFGATDDFSGVATDGSHVAFMNIATAGARNFSSISAVKNTRQTGTDGAITTGTAILTVGSTSGQTAGDVIKVAGAGAASADLYSTILSVDSGVQLTLNDNAGTTVGPSASWENPKQVTLTTAQGVNTSTTDTAWAIGGKRLTLFGTNSLKLFTNNSAAGDLMEYWIAQMESAYTETRASTVDIRRAMANNSGCGCLCGAANAVTTPVLTFSNNGTAFAMRGTNWHLSDFTIENSNATKTASVAFAVASGGVFSVFERIKVDAASSTNRFWKGFSSTSAWTISDCNIRTTGTSNIGIDGGGVGYERIIGCWIHGCSQAIVLGGTSGGGGIICGNLLEVAGAQCITIGDTGGTNQGGGWLIFDNTFADCTKGIEITLNQSGLLRTMESMRIWNNQFYDCGDVGIRFSGTGWTSEEILRGTQIDISYNNFWLCTQNLTGTSDVVLTINSTNTTVDPLMVNTGTSDYNVGLAAQSGAAFPGARFLGNNQSGSRSWNTPGALKRRSLDVTHVHLPST